MSVSNVNMPESQGNSFVTLKTPIAFQDGKIQLDVSAKDYQIRSRLDTLIRSGAIKVEGSPQQFISDVLEGVKEAKAHGDTSVSLDDVALADFTLNDAACASRLGGNRPADANPFQKLVDKGAYDLISKRAPEAPAADAGEKLLDEISRLLDPIRNLNLHI